MNLLPCHRPSGTLETAPRSALREDTSTERWEGYWCVADERYYARCVRGDGTEQWFRYVDVAARVRVRDARVLSLWPREAASAQRGEQDWQHRGRDAQRWIAVYRDAGRGRPILIGTSRRGARVRARDGASDAR